MLVHSFTDQKTGAEIHVYRTGPMRANLVVTSREGYIVGSHEVTLLFGARFGPDVADVKLWEQIAVQIQGE